MRLFFITLLSATLGATIAALGLCMYVAKKKKLPFAD